MYIYQIMSSNFGYLDIILLGMIAGFIILRLRSILGRKTGHDSKVFPNFADKKFKWKNLIPAVSVYAGFNIDSKNNPFIRSDVNGLSPSFAIYTQSNFTYRSVITTNLIMERIGSNQNDFELET